jgi:hypothetical protein
VSSSNQHSNDDETIGQTYESLSGGYVTPFRVLIGFGVLSIIGVIALAWGITDPGDFASVLIIGILSVLSFLIVTISAHRTSESVEVMRLQEIQMSKQRTIMSGQLSAMKDALGEMEAQRRLLGHQVAQSGAQITLMRDQVVQMIGQGEAMQGELAVMEKQVQLTTEQFEAWARSERAYFSIRDWKTLTVAGKTGIFVSAVFFNTGKTPALNFMAKACITTENPTPYKWEGIADPEAGSFCPPNDPKGLEIGSIIVTEEMWAELLTEKRYVYIDGECRYRDITGRLQALRYGMTLFRWWEPENARGIERYQEQYEPNAENPN